MITKLSVRFCILIVFMISVRQSFPQCPTAAEFMNNISNIENIPDDAAQINKFNDLQKLYLKCNKTKDSVYARIIHRLGNLYRIQGDYEKGINYTKEAVRINIANHPGAQRSFIVHSFFNLGLLYDDLYLLKEATDYYDSCIQFGTLYPEKTFIALMAFERKAFCFFKTADYQKSIETADNGILLSKKLHDTLREAVLLCQKAQSQLAINDVSSAENNIKSAIDILIRSDAPSENLATGYSIYASLLNRKKQRNAAISYYNRALGLNMKERNWVQCSRDLLDLGYLYDNDLNDRDKAFASYNRGIEFIKKKNDAYQLAGLYNNIGVLYWRNKNYQKALYYYQKGLNALPVQFKDTSLRSNPSADMLKLVSNDYFVYTLLSNKGEAFLDYFNVKNNKSFLNYGLNAFDAADQVIDQMRWKQYNEQSKLFWREKTKKMYEKAIESCYLLNDNEKAFYFFEKSRAVLLNDKLSELGAKKYISSIDQTMEQKLRIRILSLKQQLSPLTENTSPYNDIKSQLLIAQDNWEKFIKTLEIKYPVYYQYKYEKSVVPLKNVLARLIQNSQSLLEYFTGDTTVYILCLSAGKTSFVKVPFKNYASTAKEFLTICSDKAILNQDYARYSSLAHQLYDTLFKPANVTKGRVLISPDDHFIPFEALLSDPSVKTSFLVKDYAFSYTYSAGFLDRTRNEQRRADNFFLGIAPVDYQSHLHQQPLDGADKSLQNIDNYFHSVRLLVKEDATKKHFLENLPLFRIVHLYSHADADSIGNEPVLYLADSAVYVSDIQTVNTLPTEMIVLSACKTGVGKNARGEGIFSLARGFVAAGIPSTITTLWQIDNKPTYQLTENFYKYLSLGMAKDEALQKAKLEFLGKNDKTYELPYYWAANILLGQPDSLEEKKGARKFVYVISIVLVIGLIVTIVMTKAKRKKERRR